MGYRGALSIKAYVDKEKFTDGLVSVYSDAGIEIIIPRDESESARVHSLLVDIAMWALENPAT